MSWVGALLFGGLAGLDETSFPQAMYSRPLVAATVTGLLFGRPAEGALLGMILELFALPVMPFGAASYPEAGTAAVGATAAYLWTSPAFDVDLVALTLIGGVLLSHLGGVTVRWMRVRNARVMRGIDPERGRVDPAVVERRHLGAMTLDFTRALLVTATIAAVMLGVLAGARSIGWALPVDALGLMAAIGAGMAGAVLHVFGVDSKRRLAFLAGAVLAAAWMLIQ